VHNKTSTDICCVRRFLHILIFYYVNSEWFAVFYLTLLMYRNWGWVHPVACVSQIKTIIIASFATTSLRVYTTQATSPHVSAVLYCTVEYTDTTHRAQTSQHMQYCSTFRWKRGHQHMKMQLEPPNSREYWQLPTDRTNAEPTQGSPLQHPNNRRHKHIRVLYLGLTLYRTDIQTFRVVCI
jgi:hypothetical protein